MLIRKTTASSVTEATFACISQEQHALISGVLAAAWKPSRLDPLVVQLIGEHDNPWRASDAHPLFDPSTGLPHDFISYPMAQKIDLYRRGIDALEAVDPWVASMVSHHYCSFSGTRNIDGFQTTEKARRKRLSEIINPERVAQSQDALKWLKFFDIFSLTICLCGPNSNPDEIPSWLKDPTAWSTAPNATQIQLMWRTDGCLEIENWPFAQNTIPIRLTPRVLTEKLKSQEALDQTWRTTPPGTRDIILCPAPR